MLREKFLSVKKYIVENKAVSLACICVLGVLLLLCAKYFLRAQSVRPKQIKPLVHTEKLVQRDMYREIALFGEVKANARIDIVNKYAGVVENVAVDLGSRVNAGDLLLTQRTDDAAAELAKTQARYREAGAKASNYSTEYRANLARYEADYKLAQVNAERYDKLFALGAVSASERDAMRQTMVNKKAMYDELAAQEKYGDSPAQVYRQQQVAARRYQEFVIAQNKYDDLIFNAPRDGVIIYRNAEAGGYAPAGTKLLTLLDDSGYTVDCELSETDAAALTVGAAAEMQLDSLGEICSGEIIYVSPARAADNKFLARVRLQSFPQNIKAGIFARGKLRILQKENIIFVPKNSLLDKNGEFFAFVVGKNNKAEQRAVKIGTENAEDAEIISGLESGDEIILDNIARLRQGSIVEIARGEQSK